MLQVIVVGLLVVVLVILGTATRLKNARKITLVGAVSGNAELDGSKDVTINTTQDNIAIITGSMILEANTSDSLANKIPKQTILNIDFPDGFDKDNCICIAFGMKRLEEKDYSYGQTDDHPYNAVTGSFIRNCVLGYSADNTKISLAVWQMGTTEITVYYKIVLMKI